MARKFTVLASLSFVLPMAATSPYIATVHEYCPAPGQFINLLPEYEAGDTQASMLAKAGEALAGDKQPGAVSLGGYGGYVTFSFDHPVINVAGQYDFTIYGNALISDRDNGGGSCEPGIVWVSVDVNGNSLPDDPWYELRGSEYDNPLTLHDYTVIYTRPAAGHVATPDASNPHITDTSYIAWSASNGDKGYIQALDYHDQSYWPEWTDAATLTFTGSRLPNNVLDLNGDGSYLLLKMYDWGYADNCPNNKFEGFNLDNAVNADGTPALLDHADFFRVSTGLNQQCGSLGETSTEVTGAEDLHPDAASVAAINALGALSARYAAGALYVQNPLAEPVDARLVSLDGKVAATLTLPAGYSQQSLRATPGMYMLAAPGMKAVKLLVK